MADEEIFADLDACYIQRNADNILYKYSFIKKVKATVKKTTKYLIFVNYSTLLHIYVDQYDYIAESLIQDITIDKLLERMRCRVNFETQIHYE